MNINTNYGMTNYQVGFQAKGKNILSLKKQYLAPKTAVKELTAKKPLCSSKKYNWEIAEENRKISEQTVECWVDEPEEINRCRFLGIPYIVKH